MITKELIDVVGKFAPMVATALGSPLAGVAVSLLEGIFHVSAPDLVSTITADGDASTKLKALEYQHGEALCTLDNSDTASARERELQMQKITGKSDWVMHALAVIVIVSFFILCVLNYFYPIRDDHVLIMLIGQISSGFMIIIGYYFGSSANKK